MTSVIINRLTFSALVDGKKIGFTRTEWEILEYLKTNEDRVVSKEEIVENVFQKDVTLNTVEVYVKYIRNKVGRKYIETRRGFGYQLNPDKVGA